MLPRTYDGQMCSVARALEVVGERWTLLIVRDALLGTAHFSKFRQQLGIADNVLASRLELLITHRVMKRVRYQIRPDRYRYELTPLGRELTTVVLALMDWGDRHLATGAPPRTAHHTGCDGQVEVRLVCRECGSVLTADDIITRLTFDDAVTEPTPGPA